MNIKDIKVGDVFSEQSYYIVKEISKARKGYIILNHVNSNKLVELSYEYVQDLLQTSDQYDKEVIVGKEDKKDGTLGIRSIFENISSEVFTVVFKKQDKDKTKAAIKKEFEDQRVKAIELIEKAKKNKKSMTVAYNEALEFIQSNPVKDYIEGEDRVLRGYKIQFNSRDGKYGCIDMDLPVNDPINRIRPVNLNTISQLIVGGIKYTVK